MPGRPITRMPEPKRVFVPPSKETAVGPPPIARRGPLIPEHLRPYAISAGTILITCLATLLAWWATRSTEQLSRGGAVPIVLRVEANLPVKVWTKHAPNENRSSKDAVELIGESPGLLELSGAHVGDTIVLENAVQGAYWEQRIDFGQPGQQIILRKEFQTGHVQFRISRSAAMGLGVYRNSTQIAPYVPDVKIALVEGNHVLEIRGGRLRHPVKIPVTVKAGQVTYVTPPAIVLDD
jgi:hypothetical protein